MSQETTGMLSWAAIVAPQWGQRERPATNDSRRGTRCATTVAKLPKISPAGTARIATNVSSASGFPFGHSFRQPSSATCRPGLRARENAGVFRRVELEPAVESRLVVHDVQGVAPVVLLHGQSQPQTRLPDLGELGVWDLRP